MSFFEYLSPFCFCQLNFIVLFPFLIKSNHILFIIIVFCLGCDRPSGHLFFVPDLLFSILTPLFLPPSSVSLSYVILAVPMRKCLGKRSCMSSPFPIAILNGTFFFRSVKAMNNWKRSAIKQILQLLLMIWHGCDELRVLGCVADCRAARLVASDIEATRGCRGDPHYLKTRSNSFARYNFGSVVYIKYKY